MSNERKIAYIHNADLTLVRQIFDYVRAEFPNFIDAKSGEVDSDALVDSTKGSFDKTRHDDEFFHDIVSEVEDERDGITG